MSAEHSIKLCSRCGKHKPISDFYKDRAKKDGYKTQCADCGREVTRIWNSKNRERKLQTTLKWQKANPEARAAISKRYSEKVGRERKRQILNEWRAKNPEANRSAIARRRKKLRDSIEHYTAEDIKRIKAAQKNRCAACGTDVLVSYHVDHIIPVRSGGNNSPLNIQILCPSCNLNKNAKDPIDFMQSRGFLL